MVTNIRIILEINNFDLDEKYVELKFFEIYYQFDK